MEQPKISWQIKKMSDSSYSTKTDYFAGIYTQSSSLELDIILWNNRYGIDAVEDLESFSISAVFQDLEDSSLLEYLTMKIDGNYITPTISKNAAVFTVPDSVSISGSANDGSIKAIDNYIYITLTLNVLSVYKLKTNDYKTLSLDIVNL